VIRLVLIGGDRIDVPEAEIANREGEELVCRDEMARTVFRVEVSRVSAYGKPGRWQTNAEGDSRVFLVD
jgi:hypothetical protein